MSLSDFERETGYLPPGLHPASIDAIWRTFGPNTSPPVETVSRAAFQVIPPATTAKNERKEPG